VCLRLFDSQWGRGYLFRVADLSVPLSPPQSVLRDLEVSLPVWMPQQQPKLGHVNLLCSENIYTE